MEHSGSFAPYVENWGVGRTVGNMAYCHKREMGVVMENNRARAMTHLSSDVEGSTDDDPHHYDPVPKTRKLFSFLFSLRRKKR